MRGRPSPAEALASLPDCDDAVERRARWRQAIAGLAQVASLEGPPLLDRVSPVALQRGCRAALETGLVDDLDWIAAGPAGVALYELTTALPAGHERREVGRRVFQRVYGGTAGAFVAVATRMAWGSVRHLESTAMRARVDLCMSLPIGSSVNADPLALALVLNRERFETWVARPSLGPLPARRLAALLLERSAREAARRAQLGDSHALDWLNGRSVRAVHERLLADREPLVWHHGAVARGLMASGLPHLREEIDLLLDPGLTPTEWRRAVVSLVACLSHDYDTAMPQCRGLLASELIRRHPGLIPTFIWGLPPVIESDPEVAEELLQALAQHAGIELLENLVALLRDVTPSQFGLAVVERMLARLRANTADGEWLDALAKQAGRGLQQRLQDESVSNGVQRALVAYETNGALVARDLAYEAVDRAHQAITHLDAVIHHADDPRRVLPLLSDLDCGVLESNRLYDLLLLGRKPGDRNASVPQIDALYERLGGWILRSEAQSAGPASARQSATRRKKLVAFLHLLDVQSTALSEGEDAAEGIRNRIRSSISLLLERLTQDSDASMHRVLCAALARSFDAGTREGVVDPCDLLLVILTHICEPRAIRAITEASTNPDLRAALYTYSSFVDSLVEDEPTPSASKFKAQGEAKALADAVAKLSRAMATSGTFRAEVTRQCLLRLSKALEATARARSLQELLGEEGGSGSWLTEVERQAHTLLNLSLAANTRLFDSVLPASEAKSEPSNALTRAFTEAVTNQAPIARSVLWAALDEVTQGLPPALERALKAALRPLESLPAQSSKNMSVIPLKTRRAALPDWLMPRRTIGGFYVVRALNTGGVSSVFIAKRIEDRKNDRAELYALKVPQFDPTTARSLSEQQFMDMFRDEAGALLSLPRHPNLARFVNFDADAKPKPFLVMELIEGPALEKLIRTRSLSAADAFSHLDGLLAGLAAMHRVGVAHLDIKPSNVILRDEQVPVLVDFGLSGRQLRPGCGTLEYCAPEVLGVIPEGCVPNATAADIYAFACTAFELVTGSLLFDADDEVALMTQHVSHDGWPPALVEMARLPELKALAVVLAACLRRDPRHRPRAQDTRMALRAAVQNGRLGQLSWPFQTSQPRTHLTA